MKRVGCRVITFVAIFALVMLVPFVLTGPAGAAEQKVIKIGSIVPLSMKEGVEIQKWMNLFVKILDEQGGWLIGGQRYKVEYTAYDGGYRDVNKARSAAEKAIFKDGVKFLVNNWGDVETQTISVVDPAKVLALGNGVNDESVDPKTAYYIRATGIYFGRGMTYIILKDYMTRGAKTTVIVNADHETGKRATQLWSAASQAAGLKVLGTVFYSADTTDFGPVATKIKSYNSDLVDLSVCTGDLLVNIIVALKDAGYKGFLYPGNINPNVLDNVVTRIGKEYLEGQECQFFDPRGIQKDPEMVKLMDRYTKEYGEFRTEGCLWVGGWFIFKEAVEAVKSPDVEMVRKYLQDSKHGVMTLDGFSQLFARPDKENDRTVDVAPGHGIGLIKNGKVTPYKSVSVKDQYLASIKCYNLADVYHKYWEKYGKPSFPKEKSIMEFSDLGI